MGDSDLGAVRNIANFNLGKGGAITSIVIAGVFAALCLCLLVSQLVSKGIHDPAVIVMALSVCVAGWIAVQSAATVHFINVSPAGQITFDTMLGSKVFPLAELELVDVYAGDEEYLVRVRFKGGSMNFARFDEFDDLIALIRELNPDANIDLWGLAPDYSTASSGKNARQAKWPAPAGTDEMRPLTEQAAANFDTMGIVLDGNATSYRKTPEGHG